MINRTLKILKKAINKNPKIYCEYGDAPANIDKKNEKEIE